MLERVLDCPLGRHTVAATDQRLVTDSETIYLFGGYLLL